MTKAEFKRKTYELVDKIGHTARSVGSKAKDFYDENRGWVLGIGIPLAAKIGYDIVKDVRHTSHINEEKRLKENMIYDRSKGLYFETRKPMTTNQKLEYSRRRDDGESTESILRSMKILK